MVLAALREATSSLHHEVEDRIDFLSPDLTIPKYVRILQAFYAFFEPVEAQMDACCPAEYASAWKGRQRAQRLVDDLAALGAPPAAAVSGAFSIPDVSSTGRWLGALYVLEGSTLGGQVISRHLEKHFGWRDGRGYSFFLGHGEQTGERWRQVVKILEANPEAENQVVLGARQTFSQMNRCLSALL
jgi:heme oxygenase